MAKYTRKHRASVRYSDRQLHLLKAKERYTILSGERRSGLGLDPRDAIFENGKPVNEDAWDRFKKIPDELRRLPKGTKMAITSNMISDCWNRIVNLITGMVISSSDKQFENWCESNGIEWYIDNEHFCYIIRLKQILVS